MTNVDQSMVNRFGSRLGLGGPGLGWILAGPGQTLVGQVGYPRGAFGLHTGRVYRLGAPWRLMVDQ